MRWIKSPGGRIGPFDSTIEPVYMMEWYICMAYACGLYMWDVS